MMMNSGEAEVRREAFMFRLEIRAQRPVVSERVPADSGGSAGPVRVPDAVLAAEEPTTRSFETETTPIFLGRDQSMDVVLDDPLVSRQHAVIISRDHRFVIQDVGGRNPLRVNGRPSVSHVLRSGDVLTLGGTEIIFHGPEPAIPPGAESDELIPTIVDARETFQRFRSPPPRVENDDTRSIPIQNLPISPRGSATRFPWPTPAREGVGEDGDRLRRNLRILRNLSEVLRNLPDRQKLLEAALDTVFDNLEARRGFVGFFNPAGQLEIAVERNQGRAPFGVTYSRTIVDRVREEGVAILFSDQEGLQGSRSLLDSRSVLLLKIKGAMCLPLFRGDRVIGILYIDHRERARSYAQDDLYFANVLANLMSLALEKEELYHGIAEENLELKSILLQKNRLVGGSRVILDVQRKIKKVAAFDTTVLITGESGTGKELVARAIHDRSPRRGKPFVAVNCAAIPETLLESELFGYSAKSGISGADPRGRAGKFEQADGGTLFLDEIGDMSLSTQAKILRVLEDRVVDRLGGTEGKRVDLRILAATNKNLSREAEAGRFREDLYYRLKGFQIELPPLRDRRDDILPLGHHFLAAHHVEGRPPIELSPRTRELLLGYHWPGNCRELKNCVEEAVLMSNRRVIYPENLPAELRRDDNPRPFGTLADLEAQHIALVLQSVNWNKRRAAELLGINRSTLYEKIRLYHVRHPDGRADPVEDEEGISAPRPT
jgi:transcriptional regulator with GAF, ATPase, and Fis domain